MDPAEVAPPDTAVAEMKLIEEPIKTETSAEVTRIASEALLSSVGDEDGSVDNTLKWASEGMGGVSLRTELPLKRAIDPKEASVWSILKKNIGKNLSKISMPITLNEPLSATQRLCEELEHSQLLDKAASIDDPCQQLLYIAAFAVSGYSCTFYRGGRKPFNPLLGETFDFVDTKRKFRFVAEQVSHHPPMTVGIASHPEWELLQELGGDTKFRPTCLKIIPTGRIRLLIRRTGTVFEWNKITTSVEDIMSGNRWVDHYGNLIITSSKTKDHAVLEFKEATVMTKRDKRRTVKGSVFAAGKPKDPVYTLVGKWNERLLCPELNEVVYQAPIVSDERVKLQFGFSEFTAGLNALPPEDSSLRKTMSPTDTRLRPDQRMLELNEPNANEMKLELEQKQRERRHASEAAGTSWIPRHFVLKEQKVKTIPVSPQIARRRTSSSKNTDGKKPTSLVWEYTGGYWGQRTTGQFMKAPSLW